MTTWSHLEREVAISVYLVFEACHAIMDQLSRLYASELKQWLEEHNVPPDVVEQFQGKVYVMIVVINNISCIFFLY